MSESKFFLNKEPDRVQLIIDQTDEKKRLAQNKQNFVLSLSFLQRPVQNRNN